MSFGVDISHVPSIPNLGSVVSTPISGINNSTKSLIGGLTGDRSILFTNPMVNVIDSTSTSINSIKSRLENIASGVELNDRISAGDATTYLSGNEILDAQTNIADFLTHTNRLSGVLRGQGINLPGLEEIMSIGKQMNDYVNILNAASGCLSIIGGATGLFSENALNEQVSKVNDIMQRINRGAATIADVAETISQVSNTIRGIIDKDSQFLQNCITQLKDAALAYALEYAFSDPCAKFVLETVTSRNPGGILNKLVSK